MKHLKIYENNNGDFWVVVSLSTQHPEVKEVFIVDDEESAKNLYLEYVNELAKDDKKHILNDEDYNPDTNYIFTEEDADNYVHENEFVVEYCKVENMGKYELSKDFKIDIEAKKFNI